MPNSYPDLYDAYPELLTEFIGPFCKTCGAELERQECEAGCDEGLYDVSELYPLEYAPGELETCECCGGEGGYWFCPNGHIQPSEVVNAP